MKMLLWARWDERADGSHALTLFRRIVVETPRGEALEDIPVLVVEDVGKNIKEAPEAVELELDAKRAADGSLELFAKAATSGKRPADPKPKLTKFDDPEGERKKKARGMGRYMGKDSKPASKGAAPPVPPEQRVGGRGRSKAAGKRGAGRAVRRGGATRGAHRPSKPVKKEEEQ